MPAQSAPTGRVPDGFPRATDRSSVAPAVLVLEVDLDPGTRVLQASAWMPSQSPEVHFALHRSLEVTGASVDGNALQPVRLDAGHPAVGSGQVRWRLHLPPQARGVRIDYRGTLPALDRSLDHRGVLHALPPMASREGSFLSAGSGWYPSPSARFAYRVGVSVPADQRAVVPGRLVAEDLPGGAGARYRAEFEFAHPADGIDLMAGPWIVRERAVASLPGADGEARTGPGSALRLRTYFPQELDATPGIADAYLNDAQRYIERYSAQIGAYPFTGFAVVASPLPTGFGMPALTYLGAEVLKLPFIRATSLGHEVLHNWWGNGVLVDYARGNWSEGLTTFLADYAYKEEASPEAAREMRLAWLRDFAAVAPEAQQPLASFRSRTHGAAAAVGYGKSAMLFVMLRDRIGDEAFRRGVRAFWQRHRFRVASWDDLRTAFEQASGASLQDFFSQWLERSGGPAPRIVEAKAGAARPVDAARGGTSAAARVADGRTALTVTLQQGAPPYALRLPLQIAHADGGETRWITITRSREEVTLDVDAAPLGVRLDPDLRVWRLLDREQLPPILRQWIIARSPRWEAVSADHEVRSAVAALAARLFENPAQSIAPDRVRGGEPVLLAGLHADVDTALARMGLPPRPATLAGRGTAAVWTIADGREAHAGDQDSGRGSRAGVPDRAPVLVVSANDAQSLRALLRPLPHYGGQSWLVFDGTRMIDRGVWPSAGRLIPVVHRG